MEILKNSFLQKAYSVNNKQTQLANTIPFGNNIEEKNQVALSPMTPDYNVKVPISYTCLDDIKLNDDITAKCYKLANGQRVVIVPHEGSTYVKSYVNTGSFNEPDNLRGISHFIEHNLFNGSEDLGDKVFFNEVNKMGAYTNASTSFATTDYFIQSQLLEDTDLENQIQLHAGMVQSPKFLLDKLEKEKKIVNSEINMYMSDNESLGYTQTLKNLFNIKSSSLDLVAGTTNNITNLTRDDVVKYFNENYYPANIVTVITGEVNPDETIKLISKYFNSTKTPTGVRKFEKMTPIEKTVRQDLISPKSQSEAASLFIGFAGPENNNTKDKLYLQALSVLAGGLHNSRTSEIERKYGAYVNFSPERLSSKPDEKSVYMIESEISEDKVEEFLHDLYKAVNDLSNNPPTEDEFKAVKNKMKKSYDSLLESSGAINYSFGTALLNNDLDRLTKYNEIIDEMTPQDIVATAKKYLDLNKAALTVVHPNGTSPEKIQNSHKLVSSIPFTGKLKKTPINVDNISTYRTSNNFDVILNNADTNNFEYRLTMESKNLSPRKAALSEVLFDMIQNAGTTSKTIEELTKEEDVLGVNNFIMAGNYSIDNYANFPAENAQKALEHINDTLKNPNFSQEEFEKSVARVRDSYLATEVNPYDKFDKAMYGDVLPNYTTKECLESLKDLTLDDVKSLYNELLTTSQGMVTVTGPINKHPEYKDAILNSVAQLGQVKPWDYNLNKIYKPIEKVQVLTDVNKKNQANILEGFRFKHNNNIKDLNTVALLDEILGGSTSSRLFSDLREKRHLAYAVSSGTTYSHDMGVFFLRIGTTTENHETGEQTFDNVQKSIDGFNENIAKMMNEKVSEEELDAAKKRLKTTILSSFDTNSARNTEISESKFYPYGLDYVNKRLENIDEITAEDIQNAAKYIFSSKPIYSLTATQATLDANKDYLDSLAK
jgi:zinc protease